MGCSTSSWWLLAIPFVAIGWICAAPNLNLANGFLAYVSMIVGFILLKFHEPSAHAILTGAAAGYYLSALEMGLTAKPYITKGNPDSQNKDQTNKACDATGDKPAS
jgi:hypothetical protein